MSRPRAIVCGTTFGQVYLEAFAATGFPFELAGILAGGSARSAACARHYGVPLFTDVAQLPDVQAACVVVRSELLGGAGVRIARQLMERGIHVLQEHPLHHDELAACLREARARRVVYQLTSFYGHLPPVRRFIRAAHELLGRHRLVFIDAVCGFQVAYALFDILGEILGGLRPWAFSAGSSPPAGRPFRSVEGLVAGVPFTLRIQNQLDPRDPDGGAHLLHRITLGTDAGQLTLAGTHGPLLWAARPRLPGGVRDPDGVPLWSAAGLAALQDDDAGLPSSVVLGPAEVPGWPELFTAAWPAAAGGGLRRLHEAITAGENLLPRGQYYLALCLLWQDLAACLGPPELVSGNEPAVLSATDLAAVSAAAAAEGGPPG